MLRKEEKRHSLSLLLLQAILEVQRAWARLDHSRAYKRWRQFEGTLHNLLILSGVEMMAEALGTAPVSLITLFQPNCSYEEEPAAARASRTSGHAIILTNNGCSGASSSTSSTEEDEELIGEELVQRLNCCHSCSLSSSPLIEAVNGDHTGCLKEILSSPSRPDLPAPLLAAGVTVCHLAARRGSIRALQLLLETDPSLALCRDYKGATPLHTGARHGHLDCVRHLLLNSDCRSDTKDSDGATPVHYAAMSGKLDCLKELCIEGRADVNCTTTGGETPGRKPKNKNRNIFR